MRLAPIVAVVGASLALARSEPPAQRPSVDLPEPKNPLTPSRPPRTLLRPLLINPAVRGRDQRSLAVRAYAAVHPTWRRTVVVTLGASVVGWMAINEWSHTEQCRALTLTLAGVLACGALVRLAAVVTIAALLAAIAVVSAVRSRSQEAKDAALSTELIAAAAAAAAYMPTAAERRRELRRRGVESANWKLDESLSTRDVAVFYNAHMQHVIVAFRGTLTLSDWISNLRHISIGDEGSSAAFRAAMETTRAAQLRYVFYRSILLTGHSRGGGMADYVGRKLGIPSLQLNPATWGKILRAEDPAVNSRTARTADLVSILEAFGPIQRDRQVLFRGAKRDTCARPTGPPPGCTRRDPPAGRPSRRSGAAGRRYILLCLSFGFALCWALAVALETPIHVYDDAARWVALVGCVLAALFTVGAVHSVTQFTAK